MEKETRGGKYGRNLSLLISYVIQTMPEIQRGEYKDKFLKEIKNYSFKPRKKGKPRNFGTIYELENLEEVDIKNLKN